VKEEILAFMKLKNIKMMTGPQMEEFVALLKSGLDARGLPHPQIGPFNSAIQGMVAKGAAPSSKFDDVLAAGRKYMKHPRFQVLAAGAVISGVLGELISQQVDILKVTGCSQHYRRAMQALQNGDLAAAQHLLTNGINSLYTEILVRAGAGAALNFKTAMDRVFTDATKRVYK
jgi:hypothetical protein